MHTSHYAKSMFSPSSTQGCCSLSSLGAHFSIYRNAWQSNRFTLSDELQASIICSSFSLPWLCSATGSKEKWGSLCLPLLLPTWQKWCSVISTSGTQYCHKLARRESSILLKDLTCSLCKVYFLCSWWPNTVVTWCENSGKKRYTVKPVKEHCNIMCWHHHLNSYLLCSWWSNGVVREKERSVSAANGFI